MKKVINLTQHRATPEQIAEGVIDLPEDEFNKLCDALTINELPSQEDLSLRAHRICYIFEHATLDDDWETDRELWPVPMIGGMPALMPMLELIFHVDFNSDVYYSFSKRVSQETTNTDGSKTKTSVFKHIGFTISPSNY